MKADIKAHIPNFLTLLRLALLPVLVGLLLMDQAWSVWLGLGVYVVAALSDWLDGFLARRYQVVSDFGTFLDPIADKIFVVVILVLLVGLGRLPDLWVIVPILILAREFLVSGLREFLAPLHVRVPVSHLAKWKTGLQMLATGFLVIAPYAPWAWVWSVGQWGLALAAGLTLLTGWGYIRASLAHIGVR